VLVTLLVSYVLIGIEEIEGPFGEHHNDLPLHAICTNLEKTLRSSAE